MKRIIFLALSVLLSISTLSAANKLIVNKLILKPSDLTSSTNPVLDNNGTACGLVKIITNDKSMTFEGAVVGTPEYKNGEYWVYLPEGTYMIKIKTSKHEPLMLNFKDYNLDKVKSKATYELSFHYQDYEKLHMKNYRIISGPSLKKYAVSILTLPYGWTINGLSSLDYLKRLSNVIAKDGDGWGTKHHCTILEEREGEDIYCYKLIIESTDSEEDAIFSVAAGHGGFEEVIYMVNYE